ncbi:MAG: GGDEF domain-containing protein, partial [Candidatus Eremiobacteraeota bacterium]|nr:GGDEF domain-containing protein [Candidatus Eremiobacteraeota bacterium]
MGDRLGVPKAERLMRIVETCRDIITAALNLHQSMRAIVEVVTSLTDAYGATISLPEEGLMVCVSASKELRDRLGTSEPIAAGLAGTVYKTGEVEVDKTGDDSLIIVPLREKSRIAGVLSVYSAKSYTFTFEDVAVINLFAEIAGAALEHARTVEESYRESRVDPLTEISNRRAYTERLKVEFSRFHRYNVPFTLMLLDLDDFKRINDHFGHVEGDEV